MDLTYGRGVPSAEDRSNDYLYLALYTFALFAWELLVLITIDVGLKATGLGDGSASVLHWLITAAGWCGGAWYVLHRRPPDDGLFADPIVGSVVRRAVAVATAIAVCSGVRIAALGEWKPYAEIQDLRVDLGSKTWLGAVALLMYYAAETLVITVLVAFAQRSGELRFRRREIPWGGILLACTWGVMHIFLQGPGAGVYAMFVSVLYGVIYALGPRRLAPTVALIGFAFIA